MTRIVVFGAGGHAGRAVTAEAASRGHCVTAVVRDLARHPDLAADRVEPVAGDITDAARIAAVAVGHDAAVHAVSPVSRGQSLEGLDPHFFARAARALLAGLADAGVGRLLVVGYAGTLVAADGGPVNASAVPAPFRPFGEAHEAGLTALRESRPDGPVDWLVLTPPMDLAVDGPRTGRYGLGGDEAPAPGSAADHISYADLAVALVDQVDEPTHHRTRVSVTG